MVSKLEMLAKIKPNRFRSAQENGAHFMDQLFSDVSIPKFKDRRTGLTVFGVLFILPGLLLIFMILLTLIRMNTAQAGIPPKSGAFLGLGFITALAVNNIWLGVGSIQCRRWARTLLLIESWYFLLFGILMMIMASVGLYLNVPKAASFLTTSLAFLILFIIFPAILVVFYRSLNTKLTCETLDNVTRWTDSCPPSVLAISLLFGISVPLIANSIFANHSVIAFFGIYLSGLPGTCLLILMGVIWGYCSWALYKLKYTGWKVALISTVLMSISATLTLIKADISEMYNLMGYPPEKIEHLQEAFAIRGRYMLLGLNILITTLSTGYLLFIKKHFKQSTSSEQKAPQLSHSL